MAQITNGRDLEQVYSKAEKIEKDKGQKTMTTPMAINLQTDKCYKYDQILSNFQINITTYNTSYTYTLHNTSSTSYTTIQHYKDGTTRSNRK